MSTQEWAASLTPTLLLAVVLWLARNVIANRLTQSVRHEYDGKLERIRADIASKAEEIATLRQGPASTLAGRHALLDERRLAAVDQLWSSVISLGPARGVSSIMASLQFAEALRRAESDSRIREFFDTLFTPFDLTKLSVEPAERARPFVSELAWALFSAY